MKKAVCALVFNRNNKVLTVSRRDDHADVGLPGGKVDPGETPEQAVVREVKEETGLELSILKSLMIDNDKHGYLVHAYLGKVDSEILDLTSLEENAGVLAWRELQDLLIYSSFKEFNRKLFKKMGLIHG
jgi:mutator protein MutT